MQKQRERYERMALGEDDDEYYTMPPRRADAAEYHRSDRSLAGGSDNAETKHEQEPSPSHYLRSRAQENPSWIALQWPLTINVEAIGTPEARLTAMRAFTAATLGVIAYLASSS